MSFIEVNRNLNFYDYTEMVNTCVTRMLFDSNNTLTNKLISNLCFIAVTELATVTPHFVAISVLISCRCVKTNSIAKSSSLNQRLFVWSFEFF